jgi:zinc protease
VRIALLISCVLLACQATTPSYTFRHAEQRGRLQSNGLRFVVMPDASTSLAEVDVRFEVGSREDPPGKAGLAHLVEHLLFETKPEGPSGKSLKYFLQQVAVSWNAYTVWDKTHFTTLGRADQIEVLLQLEAMRLHYGCESITEEEFAREREVVRNEIRQRYGTPEGQIMPLVLQSVYPAGHPYHRITGGDDVQVAALTLADACDFVKRYYTPDRATLVVAGGVDREKTVRAIGRLFGPNARRVPASRAAVPAVRLGGPRKTYALDIDKPTVVVVWPVPDVGSAAGEAVEDAMLEALRATSYTASEYEFATTVSPTGRLGGGAAATMGVVIELTSLGKLDQAVDFTFKAARGARDLFQNSLEPFEEWRARRQQALITALEPLAGRTDVVADLAQFRRDYDFAGGDLFVFRELDAIAKLDEGAVRDAARAALDPAKAQVIVFTPSKTGIKGDRRSSVAFSARTHEEAPVADIDPAEAGKPLAVADDLAALNRATWLTLGNGMRVALLPVDAMPIVTARLVFDVGKATAPDKPLVADASASLLLMRPNAIDQFGTQLPVRLSRAGIRVGCNATTDTTICQARGMNIYLDDMIEGLERMTKVGEYDQSFVEAAQKQLRGAIANRRTRLLNELERQKLGALLGADHPYAKSVALTRSEIGKLGRDALFEFRKKHYSAANATLVIAGAFDPKHAESVIRHHFGDWSHGHDTPPVTAPAAPRAGATTIGVIGDEAPQMRVSILYPSAPGIGGQHAIRLIVAEMLDARVDAVRETLGATYGVNASRRAQRGPSYYEVAGTVDAARAGEALKAIRVAIESLRTGDAATFDLDFARARRRILRRLLAESNTSTVLVDRLSTISSFDMPPAYYTTLIRQVAAASPTHAHAVIASELDPKQEVVAALASRDVLEKAFAEAALTDVRFVEMAPN